MNIEATPRPTYNMRTGLPDPSYGLSRPRSFSRNSQQARSYGEGLRYRRSSYSSFDQQTNVLQRTFRKLKPSRKPSLAESFDSTPVRSKWKKLWNKTFRRPDPEDEYAAWYTSSQNPHGYRPFSFPVSASPEPARCQAQDFSSMRDVVMFRVGVGETEEIFIIHKSFACRHSPVFSSAFTGPFTEGLTQAYQLPDVDPDVFRYLVQWIYTQKIDLEFNFKPNPRARRDVGEASQPRAGLAYLYRNFKGLYPRTKEPLPSLNGYYMSTAELQKQEEQRNANATTLLVKLYVLADRLLTPDLQPYVLAKLKHQSHLRYFHSLRGAPSWIPFVYENTMEDSELRAFCVQYVIDCMSEQDMKDHAECFPEELRQRLRSVDVERMITYSAVI